MKALRPLLISTALATFSATAMAVPDITVTDSILPGSDLQMPFGNFPDTYSERRAVDITNDGSSDLTVGQVGVVNPLAAPFSVVNDFCSASIIAPGNSCAFEVLYDPPAAGAYADTFDIPSDDPDENPVTVSVSGTAVVDTGPEITVTDSVAPFDDLQLAFGDVDIALAPSDQTFTVTNDGGGLLNIIDIGSNPLIAPFSILANDCPADFLLPTASCTLTIRFLPVITGNFGDSFNITTDDADEQLIQAGVSGTGIDPLKDSNGDGILDSDAIALGLNVFDPDGDSDNDGLSDVVEVVDVNNPADTDGDGVIDALEPGADANNAQLASGLRIAGTKIGGGVLAIETAAGEKLSQVETSEALNGPNVVHDLGKFSFTTTSPVGGSVTVRLSFNFDVPNNLVIYKVSNANVYTELPTTAWVQVDLRTVDITLTDGDPLTDLDGLVNGSIDDPVAFGTAPPPGGGGGGGGGGCTLNTGTTAIDPIWFLLFLIGGIGYLQRHELTSEDTQ